MQTVDEILSRRVGKVLPSADGLRQLMAKRKIRLYLGIDPTGARLHLGHAIGLKKLMEFANAGHEAILLFGTGTVLVGDPSLRASKRQTISPAEIDENIKDWQRQAAKLVDFKKVTVKQNGDWLTQLTLTDVIKIASNISAVQLFKRESFQRRLDQGDTVWYHETMYPVLQGYDSVVMDVDLEIGGSDQEFNMLIGRELVKKLSHKEKYVLTTPMILGTDGQQMSKSSGNCIWLDDTPAEMYGKLMSIPDGQVDSYFTLCTDVEKSELKNIKSPRDLKARLGFEIVKIYHSEADAKQAATNFDKQFKQGGLPDEIPGAHVKTGERVLVDVLVEAKLAASKSEAKRLIAQNGVRLNGQVAVSATISLAPGDVLQVGKRKFTKIKA